MNSLSVNVRLYSMEKIVCENLISFTFTESIIYSSNILVKLFLIFHLLLLRKLLGLLSLSVSKGACKIIFSLLLEGAL